MKKIILIFGAGSKIARMTFAKNFKNFDLAPYSRFSNINSIKEYRAEKFKNTKQIINKINFNNYKEITAIFFDTYSEDNLIINKSKEELLKEINSGVLNTHEIIKEILPLLIKNRWGRIIHVGSSRALKGDAGISGYMTAKYAAVGYSKSISKEYGKFGITSNYLSLGLFDTPLLAKVKESDVKKIIKNTDTRNIGDIQSVTNAIKFIIKSKYVSGSIIYVDGGFD